MFSYVKFVATKKSMTTNFFHPPSLLLLFLDPGSGMGKHQDPRSGINIPDPQHWVIPLLTNLSFSLCRCGRSPRPPLKRATQRWSTCPQTTRATAYPESSRLPAASPWRMFGPGQLKSTSKYRTVQCVHFRICAFLHGASFHVGKCRTLRTIVQSVVQYDRYANMWAVFWIRIRMDLQWFGCPGFGSVMEMRILSIKRTEINNNIGFLTFLSKFYSLVCCKCRYVPVMLLEDFPVIEQVSKLMSASAFIVYIQAFEFYQKTGFLPVL